MSTDYEDASAHERSTDYIRVIRERLGPSGLTYSNDQLAQVQREMKTLAEIALSFYIQLRLHEPHRRSTVDAECQPPKMSGKGRIETNENH